MADSNPIPATPFAQDDTTYERLPYPIHLHDVAHQALAPLAKFADILRVVTSDCVIGPDEVGAVTHALVQHADRIITEGLDLIERDLGYVEFRRVKEPSLVDGHATKLTGASLRKKEAHHE